MANNDNFNAEFTFTWKIKNFSHCLPEIWVKSPIFTVESMDKTRWSLQLWPKRYSNGTYIEYYLEREICKSGPQVIRLAFELSFLDRYGIQLVKKTKEVSFKKGEFKGFADFMEQAAVYTNRRKEYLPENVLTACCRMKRIGVLPQNPVACSARTDIGVEQSSFIWNIRDFSKVRPGMIRAIRKRDPYIKVELSLTAKPEEALQFEISHAHMSKPNIIGCEISLINAFEEVACSKKDSTFSVGKVWEFPIFLKKIFLTTEKNIYLKNDILVLKFDISVSIGVTSNVIDAYRIPCLEDGTSSSSENEDCTPARQEIISQIRKEICTLRNILKEEGNSKEEEAKEILAEFSCKDTSLTTNESSVTENLKSSSTKDERVDDFANNKQQSSFDVKMTSLTVKEDYSSTEIETIPKLRPDTNNIRKDTKKIENRDEIKSKEITDEFLPEEFSSLPTGSSSLIKKQESFSTKDEAVNEYLEKLLSANSLKEFYQGRIFSDVCLTSGQEIIHAHKLILSLKSLKFKEMFMKDLSKNCINVSDLDPVTLKYLVDFIYTNNLENISLLTALKLFSAAKSYHVTTLTQACTKFIKENTNESNVCNVLIFAEEQQDEELKQLALEFMISHGETVLNTTAWDELAKKNINLAFESMQKMYMKKSVK